jgi:hypothetical protein
MMLNLATHYSSTVRDYAYLLWLYFVLLCHLVSGHGIQIKDTSGGGTDGLGECSFLCPLCRTPLTNRITLGICAIDYEQLPNEYTAGVIVDDVRCLPLSHIYLPTSSPDSYLAHA